MVEMVREGAENGYLANSSDFVKAFEVSRRTVARDLDFLRDEERAPLAYDGARHGFRLTDETYTLPPVRISRKEAFSFALARKLLAHYEGSPQKSFPNQPKLFEHSCGGQILHVASGPDALYAWLCFQPSHDCARGLSRIAVIPIPRVQNVTEIGRMFPHMNAQAANHRHLRLQGDHPIVLLAAIPKSLSLRVTRRDSADVRAYRPVHEPSHFRVASIVEHCRHVFRDRPSQQRTLGFDTVWWRDHR